MNAGLALFVIVGVGMLATAFVAVRIPTRMGRVGVVCVGAALVTLARMILTNSYPQAGSSALSLGLVVLMLVPVIWVMQRPYPAENN